MWFAMLRLFHGIVVIDFKTSLYSNVLSGIVIISCDFFASEDGLGPSNGNFSFARAVGVVVVVLSLAEKIVEQITVEGMLREVQGQVSNNEKSDLNSLLNLLCKAVVEIASTLQVASPWGRYVVARHGTSTLHAFM